MKRQNVSSPVLCGAGAILLLAGLMLGMLAGCAGSAPVSGRTEALDCSRLVSLSPSMTEIVYALHLQDQLVGDTRFCTYPPEAIQKPKVGGYLDPDMESILRLRPTLVLMRETQPHRDEMINTYHLKTLSVDHRTIPGLLASMRTLGDACGRSKDAKRLVAWLEQHVDRIKAVVAQTKERPRVLVAVDRDFRYDTIRQVYIAGNDGFFNWMIASAGGRNAFEGKSLSAFVPVSPEGILRMNPDVIIEILPNLPEGQMTEAGYQPWRASLPQVNAVRNGRLYVFNEPFMSSPGPRYAQILERIARTLHPELDWSVVSNATSDP